MDRANLTSALSLIPSWLHFTKWVGCGLLPYLQSLRQEVFERCLRNHVSPIALPSAYLSGASYILFFALKSGAGNFFSSSGCMMLWRAVILGQWPQAERGSLNKAVSLLYCSFLISSPATLLISLAAQSSVTKVLKQQLWWEHCLILKTPKGHMKSATLLGNKDCYYKTKCKYTRKLAVEQIIRKIL